MLAVLDSATSPSLAQAHAARAIGVRVWGGYLATRPGVGLYRPWSFADFDTVKAAGLIPLAYVSGQDDPLAVRALARNWGIILVCLDVEGGIRSDGPWVPGFLQMSGAGLYGNAPVHPGRLAPFYVLAGYYGFDPGATWRGNPPPRPHGFQWLGTHDEFGLGVDRAWFDDWFAQGDDMTAEEHNALASALAGIQALINGSTDNRDRIATVSTQVQALINGSTDNRDRLAAIKAELDLLQQGGSPAPDLAPLTGKVDQLSKHLGVPV